MDVNKAVGIDKITIEDIKMGGPDLSNLIIKMINICIKNGSYPDELKNSKIRPIYKGGKHASFDNYRPISIAMILDKIFQKYIGNTIMKYLEVNKLLNERQYMHTKKVNPLTNY